MRVADFDFELPADRIALRPVSPRDTARMLLVRPGAPLQDASVRNLPDLLQPGDALVFNDTRVIPAQLHARKGEARLGVTLHLRTGPNSWWAFVRNARKLRIGDCIDFGGGLTGTVDRKKADGQVHWQFSCDGAVELALARIGQMPLPPYIAARRAIDAQDRSDYQTIYADKDGAVAAPTAGLHFTPELLAALDERGIGRITLTLHVGAGTFLPVKVDDTDDHEMHSEWGELLADTATQLNAVRAGGGRIVSVGTTSLRLLESAAQPDGKIAPFCGETDIFITPGYRFAGADLLMTNFHLPKSTLFMLVSAFAGIETMRAAYSHAIQEQYRFYSYGDSSLLWLDPAADSRR